MSIEHIELGDASAYHQLADLIGASEEREPLFGRPISAEELPSLLADSGAFLLEGRLWRNGSGTAAMFGFMRYFHVNGTINSDLRFFVDPAIWHEDREAALFEWSVVRARAVGAEHGRKITVYSDCLPTGAWRKATLERHGFAPLRYSYQMERTLQDPLPTVLLPAGYGMRTVDPPADLPAWVGLFNAANAGQWNYVPTTVEAQGELRHDQRYRNQHDLLVFDPAGTPVAFCLGLVLARDGAPAGWVLEIGTHPAQRNLGLARALLAEVLRRFQAADLPICRLAVDGENPSGAQRLYTRLGFKTTSSEILYGLKLAAPPHATGQDSAGDEPPSLLGLGRSSLADGISP